MSVDRRVRRAKETPQALVATLPIFAALLVAGAAIVLPQSRILIVFAAGIVGVTFLLVDVKTVKRILLAMIVLEIPLQIDVYLNNDVADWIAGPTISGYNISATTISLLALYAIWATEAVAGAAPSSRPILRRALPAIVYMAVVLGSLFVALDTDLVLYEAVVVFQALLIMVYVAHAVQTRRDLLFILGLLLVGVLIQVGVSLLTYALGSGLEFGTVDARTLGGRVAGTLLHPNSLGGFLALLLPVAAALAAAPVAPWYRWLAAAAFATGTVVLGLSQSRGGFVGYLTAMAVLVGLVYWRKLVPRAILVRGSILAMVPLALQTFAIGSRLVEFDNESALSRLPLVRLAFAMIRDNIIWGVGANNFAAAIDHYVTVEYSAAWVSTVHNRYLLTWAETGAIGLAAFLWFLISVLRSAVHVVRGTDRLLALVAAGIFAGIIGSMVHMTVDIYHNRPIVQLLWLVAGLVIAIERMHTLPARGNLA